MLMGAPGGSRPAILAPEAADGGRPCPVLGPGAPAAVTVGVGVPVDLDGGLMDPAAAAAAAAVNPLAANYNVKTNLKQNNCLGI